MKNKFTYLIPVIIYCMITANMLITGCTKEGPIGPKGADGQDASESCTSCHNFSEFLLEKINQYDNSIHASGNNLYRTAEGCSHCHTSQGFRKFIADGTIGVINNPNPINCRTCHPIHETYSTEDFQLRVSAAVNLILDNSKYDKGNSNLCATCHQSHTVSPAPVLGGDNITILSPYWGPHDGPQANVLIGKGLYEIPGSLQYVNSPHQNIEDGCVTCHMSNTANGIAAGGHQMNITYTNNGAKAYNFNGCAKCHPSAPDLAALRSQHRQEIKNLLTELEEKLLEKQFINPNGTVITPLTVSANEAGALLNYKFIHADHSYGGHNYPYTKAILTNSIAALN